MVVGGQACWRASACIVSLFFRYFGQQLVHLRDVDPHEPAKGASPLPPNSVRGRIRNPERTVGTDPYVTVRANTPGSGDVAPDVRLRQVRDPRHEKEIPRPASIDTGRCERDPGLSWSLDLALGPGVQVGGCDYALNIPQFGRPLHPRRRGRVDA
jgi:hypothetical protein